MARLTADQRIFVVGVCANALDSGRSRAHTKKNLAKQCNAAWNHKHGEWIGVSVCNIETALADLKDAGYLIMPDPKGKGVRCECGVRNPTPNALGIVEGIGHQKRIVAKTIETQIVAPTQLASEKVMSMQLDQARHMIAALQAQTSLYEAIDRIRGIDSREYVLIPKDVAESLTHDNGRRPLDK